MNLRLISMSWVPAPEFLMVISYSRESSRIVTSQRYSSSLLDSGMHLKIMRSKDTFLARSSGTNSPVNVAPLRKCTDALLAIISLPSAPFQDTHVAVLVSTKALEPFSCSNTYVSK